jgi:hypothetical protein
MLDPPHVLEFGGSKMTLQEVANIGEILGAAGVIGSLIFVGWQIKSNTRTARLRMHEQATQTLLSFLNTVLTDPDAFSAGLQCTDENFSDLTDGQKMFFFGTMLGFFKHFELLYVQHAEGVMDQESWDAWSEQMRMYYYQPGAQNWWKFRRATFIPGFRDYLESSTGSEMKSFVDIVNS